ALDAYRRGFESIPDTLTNAILLGSLIVPLGFEPHEHREPTEETAPAARRRPPGPRIGQLPLARRDVERLRQILILQRRLLDLHAHPRAQHALTHRSLFRESLTWMEIHGDRSELVQHWKGVLAMPGADTRWPAETEANVEGEPRPFRRRRR